MSRRLRDDAPVVGWSSLLAVVVLGPGLAPGFLLVRDMVWVPDLALRDDVLGLGSALPRAVPSDALVAVLDEVVPGQLLQKLVLLLALSVGGVGAARLLDRDGTTALVPRLVAVTVYDWNAWVAERLLMGQWPVLVGYAVLPWLLVGGRRWRETGRLPLWLPLVVPLGCLSASAGLVTTVALLLAAAGRGRHRLLALVLVAGNLPWLAAGLLHAGSATSDARAATVFALHGEGPVPAPLAALSLGGIWNAEVVPGSRSGALGWVTLVVLVGLALVGLQAWRRGTPDRERDVLLGCWAVGFGWALLTWLAPGAVGWAAAHVPGAGVARDGARVLALCAPLLAVLVAQGVAELAARAPAARPARVALGLAAVLVPVALLPDLTWGAGRQLQPAAYPEAYGEARAAVPPGPGDVLSLPLSAYRAPAWNGGRPVLDPVGRYLTPDYVASDVLVVDGVPLAGEDPRVTAAAEALARPTARARAEALAALGIGAVALDPTAPGAADVPAVAGERVVTGADLRVVLLADPDADDAPAWWVLVMAAAWAAYLLVPAGIALHAADRASRDHGRGDGRRNGRVTRASRRPRGARPRRVTRR